MSQPSLEEFAILLTLIGLGEISSPGLRFESLLHQVEIYEIKKAQEKLRASQY